MSLRWSEEDYQAYLKERGKGTTSSALREPSPEGEGKGGRSGDRPYDGGREGRRIEENEPTEDEEQIALFEWAAAMEGRWPELQMLFHIPNGGYRMAAQAARFRAMGVKAGVPDLFLPVARGGYNGLFIELKRRYGGNLSDRQRDWLDNLSLCGYAVHMCHGWVEAAKVIEEYLKGGTR